MLNAEQRKKLNRDNPTNDLLKIGDEIGLMQSEIGAFDSGDLISPILGKTVFVEDASAGVTVFTAGRSLRLVGVNVVSKSATASGAITILDHAGDTITDAIPCITADAITYPTTIKRAKSLVSEGETIKIKSLLADDEAYVTLMFEKG